MSNLNHFNNTLFYSITSTYTSYKKLIKKLIFLIKKKYINLNKIYNIYKIYKI